MKPTVFTYLGLALALLGPGVVAFVWTQTTRERLPPGASAPWLVAFIFLLAAVAMIALRGEKLTWAEIGFGRMSWLSAPSGFLLALFFIFIFGPIASWVLTNAGLGSFSDGRDTLARLPVWYISMTVVVVAAGEEWLYRGYAIERLHVLIGNIWLAGAISLLMFAIVHLPLWGIGASLTTLVSGGIFTALYIWRNDVSFLILAHVITDLYGLVIAPQ